MVLVTTAIFSVAFLLVVSLILIEGKYRAHVKSNYPELYEQWRAIPPPGERILVDWESWRIWRNCNKHLTDGDHESLGDDYLSKVAKMAKILTIIFILYMCLVFPFWLLSI
jgi:hypothetical protein